MRENLAESQPMFIICTISFYKCFTVKQEAESNNFSVFCKLTLKCWAYKNWAQLREKKTLEIKVSKYMLFMKVIHTIKYFEKFQKTQILHFDSEN